MTDEAIPEPDRVADAPHPRETERLIGQATAERTFIDAWNAGRPHHAWMIAGPQGVGKATLAWRIARFLLTEPPASAESLDARPGHPALTRIRALSDPRLVLLRRPWDEKRKRLRAEITVDETRRLAPFFGLSADGRRVVIVDAADDLNRSAANAILKLLEEPPARTTFLLVAHQPARLLPTIRSRCRTLRLDALSPAEVAAAVAQAGGPAQAEELAELACGSVGVALSLARSGAEIYADLVRLYASAMDDGAARRLADGSAGRGGSDQLGVTLDLIQRLLHRAARASVAGPLPEAVAGEAVTLSRLAPDLAAARRLAAAAQDLSTRAVHARAVNIDAGALIWDQLTTIEAAARG